MPAVMQIGESLYPLRLPRVPDDMDFLRFCENNEAFQFEREANGEITFTGPADAREALVAVEVGFQLGRWNDAAGEPGLVFGPTAGFTLASGAVRAPDASWLPYEKWNALSEAQQSLFAHLCPDFVVELMSPSDRLPPAKAKMREYRASGALLGLLIDRKSRTIHVYRTDAPEPEQLHNPTMVSCDPVVPGFTLNLTRVFRNS